ncbi:hypothetical protein TSAR_002454 [Trichomalopsis sarcophagae]|uniref:Pseudouridine synthase II N-terminal domain-containing protein n=1 Tax=Trichomalopsis sarcophagae TaxID=543379 RepID=A0A232ELH5_9HYME|nr:hypothetical protein TSAR_002454 [Trichomalopsis sarcophagae]
MNKWIKDASLAWNLLNGVFILYKPPGIHHLNVRKTVIQNLCRDLNQMEIRPPNKYISIEGPTTKEMDVIVRDSYADDPLVVGPRYVVEDFKFFAANYVSPESSGVMVCGVNHGTRLINKLMGSKLTKFYKLKGIFGQARHNDFATGRIVEKSTWKKIKRFNIDNMCASMQASHQKKMFELCGIDMQTQAAYELAIKGPIRPADPRIPMVYNIKCIDFKPPEFTLEIVAINETDEHLKAIVAELGYKLHSTAYCSQIQCTQFGLFNVKDSLLSKYWDLQSIMSNISLCRKILQENPFMLNQEYAHLVKKTAE